MLRDENIVPFLSFWFDWSIPIFFCFEDYDQIFIDWHFLPFSAFEFVAASGRGLVYFVSVFVRGFHFYQVDGFLADGIFRRKS